ncbi:MAG: DUF4013 domain-containing protein [Chloroflexi bacterium]|jgi:hypothetical protein|nr:DUF4013 domain-containing protein [Chloroflexota bacterium]MBT3670911.1 DUF4013 domain-containing protein [Chloroflexota bacterium]MBT4002740.1 DUF4013 domain-containing protein [Chloroflexota bacterium]MBT4306375.1 DUF4013 domain-containing protein [Chloroflexota bacterium]MBT4532744.1 DUF4013 domain-containing protein [Chloroflexota bacterium]
MDFARSFSFITEDKDWFKKVGIAALLVLTGIGSIGAMGWVVEITKRVANGDPEPLPGWENIGDYFINGLKLMGVTLVWSLPIILLTICSTILLIPASEGFASYDDASVFMVIMTMCLSVLVILYSLVVGLLAAPLFGLIGEGLSFSELIKPNKAFALLKTNIGGYLLAFFAGSIISTILSSIGVIACFIGAFFGTAFGYGVMGHLIGQAHAQAREKLAMEPIPEE